MLDLDAECVDGKNFVESTVQGSGRKTYEDVYKRQDCILSSILQGAMAENLVFGTRIV